MSKPKASRKGENGTRRQQGIWEREEKERDKSRKGKKGTSVAKTQGQENSPLNFSGLYTTYHKIL
jgi:hypothetical protein